jgi:phage terminase large subunit-like protein
VDVAKLLGWDLFPWQRHAVEVAMEYDRRTRLPFYRTVGISVARQNGKTTLMCARIGAQLIVPGTTVAYTAQDRGIARFKWREHCDRLMATPFADRVERIDHSNAREQLVMNNGSRYLIVTPNERAGRALSLNLVVIDEAHAQETMSVVGALSPTMVAQPHAQLWMLSNAGTFRSALWRHYTEAGRAAVDDATSPMCWLEWAAAEDAENTDRAAWVEANPSLGLKGGVTEAGIRAGLTALDSEAFRREHLNLWVDVDRLTGIDPLAWAACRDDALIVGEGVALGLDFTPERDRGCLVAAGLPVHGRTPIEVLEHTSDLERLVTRAAEVAERWDATVTLDRSGPAASAIPALERAGARLRVISTPDFVRACGDFHDAAVHALLAHRGDYRLTDAVAAATKRTVGDAWAWRRRGGADISPLVAATLGRWAALDAAESLEPPAVY